jgi:hypothetical protein
MCRYHVRTAAHNAADCASSPAWRQTIRDASGSLDATIRNASFSRADDTVHLTHVTQLPWGSFGRIIPLQTPLVFSGEADDPEIRDSVIHLSLCMCVAVPSAQQTVGLSIAELARSVTILRSHSATLMLVAVLQQPSHTTLTKAVPNARATQASSNPF